MDNRFDDIVYLVEATSTEQFFLWREFNRLISWEPDQHGYCYTIHENKESNRPICVCFSWAHINNKRIAFWECTSQLADYLIIEKWLQSNFPKVEQTDAINFHHVVHEVYPEGWPVAPLVPEDFRELILRAEKAKQTKIEAKLKEIVQWLKWDKIF